MTGVARVLAALPLLLAVAILGVIPFAMAEGTPAEHGLAPLPDDARVPVAWLPPGADPDLGPSDVVYPIQHVTLRFDHRRHLARDIGATCATCHPGASTSRSAGDHLTPAGRACDGCHGTDHADLARVSAGRGSAGACGACHLGYRPGDGNRVAEVELPRANLVFDHRAHAARNIGCAQCHGAVDRLELATRDQLPAMRGCLRCHQGTDSASRGDAKGACTTCHLAAGRDRGRIRTMFTSGTLLPPRWMQHADHTPDFVERHKWVAADDSQLCASCHEENFCADCHDGRVRPRSVHPSDYLNMHAVEAQMPTQRCTSCHEEQGFCLECHLRVGVGESSPPGARDSGRFHPPKTVWSEGPTRPGHHGFEAERNLGACVSCHTERDCVACHGASGVGAGFNPHRAGFEAGCAAQLRRNPRPCFVCHERSDPALGRCL